MIFRLGSVVESGRVITEPDNLSDEQIEILIMTLKKLQNTYFQDMPLSENLSDIRKFIYNIPDHIMDQIMTVDDDLMNPAILLYPMFADQELFDYQSYYETLDKLIAAEFLIKDDDYE